jgi:hypothetical protein
VQRSELRMDVLTDGFSL